MDDIGSVVANKIHTYTDRPSKFELCFRSSPFYRLFLKVTAPIHSNTPVFKVEVIDEDQGNIVAEYNSMDGAFAFIDGVLNKDNCRTRIGMQVCGEGSDCEVGSWYLREESGSTDDEISKTR
mmetsp:Transcript_24980/g.54078  ORF Transcript_24980/g.54078 Transcript_24980/m.54078 type:complete len:122 (+) Transcript_24980:176-541(+)